ncbi:hypothetical protein FGK63_02675 [Ruegeria sediminis]|uniref:Secreted protein n=1 Tax=Ruegeria sediminis TaxID=2583820 RepID=A0ABY2X3N0_9RHOB|nr:hypothetical protein [Ruegeria sediminis]TMV09992.1 hypothetical protein FGK63_02675 [Ruegeria sediminis]
MVVLAKIPVCVFIPGLLLVEHDGWPFFLFKELEINQRDEQSPGSGFNRRQLDVFRHGMPNHEAAVVFGHVVLRILYVEQVVPLRLDRSGFECCAKHPD